MVTPNVFGEALYRDQFLSQFAWEIGAREGTVTDKIAPLIPVEKPTGNYWMSDPAFTLSNTEYDMEYATEPQISDYAFDSGNYDCPLRGIDKSLTFKQEASADASLELIMRLTRDVGIQLRIGWEQQGWDELSDKNNWKASSTYKVGTMYSSTPRNKHHFVDYNGTGSDNSDTGGRLADIPGTSGSAKYKWSDQTNGLILQDIGMAQAIVGEEGTSSPEHSRYEREGFRGNVQE